MSISLRSVLLVIATASLIVSCGRGSGGGSTPPPAQTRAFMMGSTPFFATPAAFPDWKFENTDDRDLLSVHVDDFLGVPWNFCDANGCTIPNSAASWSARWTSLITAARNSGKTLYLSLSPLKDRKRLAPTINADGSISADWESPGQIDTDGCYRFATDGMATIYRNAYFGYLQYVIDQLQPSYLSPAIEMNIQFHHCPQQRAAWIDWYSQLHTAIKAKYPNLVVFATFHQEEMYGIIQGTACASGTVPECFQTRLNEVLTIPGDRIAFSTYPLPWKFQSVSHLENTYNVVKQTTSRKIWISETGWAAVRLLQSYQHGASSSCGAELIPASIANDNEQAEYMKWLLSEAQTHKFEAVVWWLNRDFLDGPVAHACPCTPADSDTCKLTENFYSLGGTTVELLLRNFSNMALRHYDGTPRSSHTHWRSYMERPYRP